MKYNVIVTAGGTSERIDNVRKITNSSSGKLGCLITENLLSKNNINKIYYVCSKGAYKPSGDKIEIIEIFDTKELEKVIKRLLKKETIHYFIHSMAVSDFTVDYITTAERLSLSLTNSHKDNFYDVICNHKNNFNENKISSKEDNLITKLKKAPKIISLIKDISPNTFLVGFKLLDGVSSDELIKVAIKLKDKNKCDLVVANDLSNIRNGKHKAFIIRKDNSYIKAFDKNDIALKLTKEMFKNEL